MNLANVIFGARHRKEPTELEDVADSYLASLLHSGQICGEYFLTWTRGRLNAHVLIAGPGASEPRHHSKYGKQELRKVSDAFGRKPAWTLLDDNAPKRSSSWRSTPFLYLFTHAFDWASPVCRGDGKPPIPVFMLPMSFEHKQSLYFWQRSYYHHDHVWLCSGALEIGAYRQMADPNSDLAEHGRELCREIETATGLPTFYYLTRYWGRPKGEDKRRCPGCGAEWRTNTQPEISGRFWHFDFKCDRCRLVSHFGVSTDGGRHVRIGEFTARTKSSASVGDLPENRG